MKKLLALTFAFAVSIFSTSFAADLAPELQYKDPYTIIGEKNLYRDFEPINADRTVNAIIEIPTGNNDKWEVGKDGVMTWEIRKGKPRIVEYLGYAGNYGMIPRTLGGDGDSLDILVLGPSIPRGTWVSAKVIGALKLEDGGEVDDKLIAVIPGSYFGVCNNLAELNQKFPGVTTIIETWFSNYKGPGKMKSLGFAESGEAAKILEDAIKAYK